MFDIIAIRDQLNEVAFEHGKRAVCIGSISELFADQERDIIEAELRRFEEQLRERDLVLERGGSNSDELYVAQQLKYREVDTTWMAKGMQWVSKITTVALEMVVPIVIGTWLDQKLDTQFLGLLGIVLGVPLGLWHLIKMTKRAEAR
ncbi:MAG: AtpZ/AtpI family protein [Planctomycetes bacterium]|nr:AtpZ/AtpI family protein [Planctomycetota bacterium]